MKTTVTRRARSNKNKRHGLVAPSSMKGRNPIILMIRDKPSQGKKELESYLAQ